MRKITITSLIAFFAILNLKAQDVIIKKDGENIKAKISEITTTEIKYKKFDNLNGPVYTVSKADIMAVNYENGTKENYNIAPAAEGRTITDDFIKGQRDADVYYTGYKPAGTGTLVISLLSPLVGLVPAIACSSTPPKKQNLEYPNANLFDNNMDYQNGYFTKAKKKKSGKVWTNWGIAFGVNIVLVLALLK